VKAKPQAKKPKSAKATVKIKDIQPKHYPKGGAIQLLPP
jgi:hypothetical protein